jgi:hypothetical protein
MLNRVLTNLSEDEIAPGETSVTDTYMLLVRNFINHIKEEMEDAQNWRALRSVESVTVLASTDNIAIPNANERSRLVRVQEPHFGEERALVFDVTDTASPYRMQEMDLLELLRRQALDTTTTNVTPQFFALDNTSGGGVSILVHPTPSVNRDLQVTLVIPQDRFVGDAADIDTVIKIPAFPIEMGATWYSLEERGEELGVNAVFSERRYKINLDSAIARDVSESGGMNLVPV